jgi:hypothetical protein
MLLSGLLINRRVEPIYWLKNYKNTFSNYDMLMTLQIEYMMIRWQILSVVSSKTLLICLDPALPVECFDLKPEQRSCKE